MTESGKGFGKINEQEIKKETRRKTYKEPESKQNQKKYLNLDYKNLNAQEYHALVKNLRNRRDTTGNKPRPK